MPASHSISIVSIFTLLFLFFVGIMAFKSECHPILAQDNLGSGSESGLQVKTRKRKLDIGTETSRDAKEEVLAEKVSARARARARKAKWRAQRTEEQKKEDKDKDKTRKADRRAQRTEEEHDEDKDKGRTRMAERRARRTKEEHDEDKDKDRTRKADSRAETKESKQKFKRGFIYDDVRQLHTVWILHKKTVVKKTLDEKSGEIIEVEVTVIEPVAKYLFKENVEDDPSKSNFALCPVNENDKRFIQNVINQGLPVWKGRGRYWRLGPWTGDDLQGPVPDKKMYGVKDTKVALKEFPKQLTFTTSFSLGEMDQTCMFCKAKGFKDEVQNTYKGKETGHRKGVDFGCLCCKSGTVDGIKEYNLPPELEDLFTNKDDEVAKCFRKHSRNYNNGMAMASVAAEKGFQTRCYKNKMESMLTAGGQLLRRIGPLEQKEGNIPRGAQCMFYGPEDAARHRATNAFKGGQNKKKNDMDKTIFTKLHRILIAANNKYIDSFLSVKEYVKRKGVKGCIRDLVLAIHANESTESLIHQGRLNAPRVKEVALLMPNEIRPDEKRFLLFNYKEPDDRVGLEFIPDYHRSYDPLQYPLLFPDGRDGWHFGLDHTLLEHINYMMMDRDGITNPILCSKTLGQQFILDQYCKVELERLRWVELNQKTIRAELYSGLGDSVKKCEDLQDLGRMGKKVILPSTFTGGERYMHQQFLDSMALFQKFGRPHFFITATANPNWKEIQDALKVDQSAFDRPDLVARVFKLKKQQLIRELQSEFIFGNCVARTHCIEFQKRGLPHVHILVWLETDHHFDSSLVDKVICAEIPEPKIKYPELDDEGNIIGTTEVDNPLHKQMKSFMLHGPCGEHNPTLSCMCGGFCKYNYPKDYAIATELNEDGYPTYRRRSEKDGGNAYETWRNNKRVMFTNADVIPYSKYLILRFGCHINVEYCHSISAIKYLFGYINKGCDQATVEVQAEPTSEQDWTGTAQVSNEVLEYQTKRYVSVAEGCWRLRKNEIAERKPAVFRMNVHLPGQQTVYYNPDEYNFEDYEHKVNMEEFKQKMNKAQKTPLTEYFANQKRLNSTIGRNETEEERNEREHNTLLFRDMPDRYRWDATKKCWKQRKRGIDGEVQIGRVYTVHPTEIERYSLRLLLNHVKGKESFEDLRTVDGNVYPTFHAAAVALNLVKNDKIWIECMKEAHETQRNIYLLRRLFVTILLNCQVGDPKAFYDTCSTFLYSDYLHRYKQEFEKCSKLQRLAYGIDTMEECKDEKGDSWTVEQYAENSSLIHLQDILQRENRSLALFHLPEPDPDKEQFLQNILKQGQVTVTTDHGSGLTKKEATEYFNENFPKLNKDQLHVFNTLKNLLEESIEYSKRGKVPRENNGTIVFLDAPGGTGKTFTLNVLISWVVMKDKLVAASAASGIASTMLHNGRTAHNQFKLPINITQDSVCNISKQQDLASFLQDVLLIIIDEATMLDRYCYECLDRTLKDFTEEESTRFGGKCTLISGDFRQLLEVIPGANRAKTVQRCLKGSDKLWGEHVIHLKLRENMRVKNAIQARPNDEDFKAELLAYEDWLLKLGEGRLPTPCQNIIEIPPQMCLNSKDEVIASVFDDFESNIGCSEYYKSRAIIAATNETVNEVNHVMTDRLPGDVKIYKSIDNVGDDDDARAFPTEFLNSLHLSGMADHELRLKVNSVVILLRNIDLHSGHSNGSRYFVKELGKFRLTLEKLEPKGDGNDILILPRMPMSSTSTTKLPFVLNRLQFPIKVAFAITVNRSQSQSFGDKLGLILPKSIWVHGQLYVMFSRTGNSRNIYIYANQDEFQPLIEEGHLDRNKKYTRNIVFKEVIS